MKKKWICSKEEDLYYIASQLFAKYPHQLIFSLKGDMGVGKTTFMKYVCRYLQSKDKVSSPTFSIVNEYELPNNKKLYHFDFYRIKSIDEAINIGVEDYFYSNHYCFFEWAERINTLLPPDTIEITISIDYSDNKENRIFSF
ncbi:MAG TPA: tRNA (adenosine(37)-N6)-threonylcarbamoyltransferase complex ATPase subunit type 1 TsaE [Bacteroidales bacterium]|jgi:tRNA threonylcarbamoyladenosine biosynthesis protein TsaE|nr:tRNA (adenosine(37)-N6)-threonylcarbamoyltransferase complex ATPase subunit type 1 TsaE [Bacteroidales bacterium]HOF15672.1 tRNA (adenosine(37)-N6)-threonylcarbamoyltransferase complex ATPase subunit type 1 TsaE [Bacteroidales bacterium]HOR81332.1 tRNA (adenosine(37)-N6)-threonylcarbamoyltransferase complex ATPase subunit type 1 TsaE [Bacteroidales bacterium]HPJ90810.1 tRNA (adenosine(37)-N6)-threonylcarbamoyltransferase complex ATPase subunit type 1 TsaE [Bacteroidales bacterium]HPX59639.1 